jgi:tetratricopeptide (TPR) repeat protein
VRALLFCLTLASVPVLFGDAHAAPLSAEEKKAAKAFSDGQAAFEAGDFRRAAGLFETAYATKPHHSALWNAAKSWQRAGEDLTAVNLLERYLKEAPADASNRAEANAALAAIEKRVGRIQLQIVSVSNAALDGNAAKEGLSYVAPGEHVLTADDQGKTVRRVVPVKAGEIVSVTLSHEEEKKPKVIVVEKAVPTKPLSPWFVVGGGVLTAGGVAATIYFGLQTLDKKQAFIDAGQHDQEQFNEANASQLETNIALGATIGVAVITTAVAIFFVDWHGSKTPEAEKTASWRVAPGGVTF